MSKFEDAIAELKWHEERRNREAAEEEKQDRLSEIVGDFASDIIGANAVGNKDFWIRIIGDFLSQHKEASDED